MPFNLLYRDYLQNNSGGSEAGGLLDENSWNQLSPEQQASLVNFNNLGTVVGRNDSRYQQLAGQTQAETNRPVILQGGSFDPARNFDQKGNQIIKDPSRVYQGDGYFARSADNETPGYQAGVADSGMFKGDKWDAAKVAAFLAAGPAIEALAAGGGGIGAGTAGAYNESAGLLGADGTMGGGAATGGGLGAGTAGSFNESAGLLGADGSMGGGAAATGGATGTAGGGLGGYANGGMVSPGMETAADLDSLLINHGMSGLAGGNLTAGNVGGLLSNAGSWALSHPLQAYGLVQTAGGLLHHGGGSSSSGGGSGSKSGGGTNVGGFKAERPQYTPNPFLINQLRSAGYQI